MIGPETMLVQEPGVLGTNTATQRVLLNERFEYLGLDPIAEHIFELLESPLSLSSLVGILTMQFNISAQQCRRDIEPFLEQMINHKLIRAS